MTDLDTHVTRLKKIGNSLTIRIPKRFVDKFFPDGEVILEATEEGLFISPKKPKLSYEKAAREMAEENENWRDWDVYQDAGTKDLGDW